MPEYDPRGTGHKPEHCEKHARNASHDIAREAATLPQNDLRRVWRILRVCLLAVCIADIAFGSALLAYDFIERAPLLEWPGAIALLLGGALCLQQVVSRLRRLELAGAPA